MISNKNNFSAHTEDELVEPQLNIVLTTDEDDLRPVYISGNFNHWHTQDQNFRFQASGWVPGRRPQKATRVSVLMAA